MGFWGIETPEEYGGANMPPTTQAIIKLELSKSFVPFKFGGWVHNILFSCNEDQKQRYLIPAVQGEKAVCFALSEASSASDATNMQTTAKKDGNDWIINGEKIWITGGHSADFAIVFAANDKSKGAKGGITAFLVDREMGWKSELIDTMVSNHEPATLIFDNVRVPEENVIGEVGYGFKYAMQFINHNRGYVIPAYSIGAAERMLSMAVEYANTRTSFGKPLAERQAIQWMIANSATDIEAAKGFLFRSAALAEKEGSWKTGNDSNQFRTLSSMAKLYNANMVNRVVDDVMQIFGGMGVTKELPIERWYRNVRVYRIFEGSDEMLRRTIAKNLLNEKIKVGEIE
ncbi:acyl-CoA dehydrogenase [Neobacillus niacini]|nr:acyl-CoA dehydrogenase [Neobacillus niacini]